MRRFNHSGYQNNNCLGCGLLVEQCFSAELAHFIVIQCSSEASHLQRAQSKFHRNSMGVIGNTFP